MAPLHCNLDKAYVVAVHCVLEKARANDSTEVKNGRSRASSASHCYVEIVPSRGVDFDSWNRLILDLRLKNHTSEAKTINPGVYDSHGLRLSEGMNGSPAIANVVSELVRLPLMIFL